MVRPRGDFEKFEQNGEFLTKIENILTYIGQWPRWIRLMKKNGGRKSRWTVPLRETTKS